MPRLYRHRHRFRVYPDNYQRRLTQGDRRDNRIITRILSSYFIILIVVCGILF